MMMPDNKSEEREEERQGNEFLMESLLKRPAYDANVDAREILTPMLLISLLLFSSFDSHVRMIVREK